MSTEFLPGYKGKLPKGKVMRTGRTPVFSKARLVELVEYSPSGMGTVTHVQVKDDGSTVHFLETHGLESWAIFVPAKRKAVK